MCGPHLIEMIKHILCCFKKVGNDSCQNHRVHRLGYFIFNYAADIFFVCASMCFCFLCGSVITDLYTILELSGPQPEKTHDLVFNVKLQLCSLDSLIFKISVLSRKRSFSLKFILGQKNMLVPRKMLSLKKTLRLKNFRSIKVFGRTNILGPKEI